MRKTIWLMLILCLLMSHLIAQYTFIGTVFNEAKETLIGASILVPDTIAQSYNPSIIYFS